MQYADRARVLQTGRRTHVPVGCYQDALVTDEWDEVDPAARQRKH